MVISQTAEHVTQSTQALTTEMLNGGHLKQHN